MEDEYPDQLFKSLIKDIELQLDLGIRYSALFSFFG